jgi:ubiquinone biosynthesis protein COQ9
LFPRGAYSPGMTDNQTIKDKILHNALADVPFDGWSDDVLKAAAIKAGYKEEMVIAVFPRGLRDALVHFSSWVDRRMLDALKKTDPSKLKVRECIALAVRTRLEVLEEHREAERLAIAYWIRPFRKIEGAKLVWKTADLIWVWAGDTATDYNHYTKRGLLSGVLTSTVFFWLNDQSAGFVETWAFLDRRIDDVLSIGKIVGRFKTA